MPGKGDRDDLDLEPEQMRKIFIGGLDYGTTEETLEAYFERWGDIVDLVVMKDPYTKRSRGFGFVTYAHSEMVDEAMSHRPHKIDGREVETKRAIPKDEIEHIPQQALDVKKLFVGGLKHLEEPDLTEHFSQFGAMVSCDVIVNRDTGEKRGFAFIEFDDTDAVDKVILHKKHEVKGVRLFVKKAVEWNEIKKGPGGFRSRGGFRGGRGSRGGRGGDDYYERRSGGYGREEYEGGRRGGRGGRGGYRGSYHRGDDQYESGYRGSSRRSGYRDDEEWEERPPRREFRSRDDDWEAERPSRRFRDDSMERGYGGGGGRWDDGPAPKKSWGGGDSWRRSSPERGSSRGGRGKTSRGSGYRGDRYGGGGGPVRSSFSSSRSAPYDTSYPLNRRGRY